MNGRGFTGKIEAGKSGYEFTFLPKTAALIKSRLILTGSVTVKSAAGQKRTVDKVTATLRSTQGSTASAPPVPSSLPAALIPSASSTSDKMPITEATAALGSVAALYFKLSRLDGKALGVPMDLSEVQLNARLYPTSETERDLHWLYSAAVYDEQKVEGYVAEIDRIFKA